MKPELREENNNYTMVTASGETVRLSWADMQEIARYLRHREWKAQILEKLDEDCIILTERERENFLSECMDEADSKYEIYGDEPNIMDVYESVAEDWGMF